MYILIMKQGTLKVNLNFDFKFETTQIHTLLINIFFAFNSLLHIAV